MSDFSGPYIIALVAVLGYVVGRAVESIVDAAWLPPIVRRIRR
jgi:hypothetical protein